MLNEPRGKHNLQTETARPGITSVDKNISKKIQYCRLSFKDTKQLHLIVITIVIVAQLCHTESQIWINIGWWLQGIT